jgi:hypothetical protein
MSDTIQKALHRGADCPELAQLFDAMTQNPADPRRVQAEEHLKTCPCCQTEWSLYLQFEAGEVRPDERAAVDFIVKQVHAKRAAERTTGLRSSWRRFWTPAWMGGAALAMAALVVAIGLTSQWRARHSSPDTYSDNQTLRSQTLEITTPLHEVTQVPAEIKWKMVPDAVTYSAVLTEVDGTRIFYTKVTLTTLSLPDSVRKLLGQGRTLLLAVTASDSSAREIAHSGIVRIHINTTR